MYAIPTFQEVPSTKKKQVCRPVTEHDASQHSDSTATESASPEVDPAASLVPPQTQPPSKLARKIQAAVPQQQISPPLEASRKQHRERWQKRCSSHETDAKFRAKAANVRSEQAAMIPDPKDISMQRPVDTSLAAYQRNISNWNQEHGVEWKPVPPQTEFEEDVVDEAYQTMSRSEQSTFRRAYGYAPEEHMLHTSPETFARAQVLAEEYERKRKLEEMEDDAFL